MLKGIRTALAIGVLAIPAWAQAAIWNFEGGMNAEQSAATHALTLPPIYFGGGVVNASLDTDTGWFTWEYSFAGMSSPATVAHFHEAPAGVSGPVTVPTPILPTTSGTVTGAVELMGSDLTDAIAALTGDGAFMPGDMAGWYLNIHNAPNPAGELRGQLFVTSVVPVPAAVWMMLSAVGVLAGTRRLR